MEENKTLTVQSLGDAVKDKVRKAMMDAIPDEALQALIKAEFDNFFQDQSNRYDNGKTPSPFKVMVRNEIEKAVSQKVRDLIQEQTAKIVTEWDGDNHRVLGDLVTKLAPAALEGVMHTIAGRTLQGLRNTNY
jgi:uncharacterized protein YajQ (UPF0234 family)